MRETKIYKWCDRHWPEEVEAPVTRIVGLDQGARKSLDLCELCDKELFGQVAELLETYGQSLTPAADPPGRRTTGKYQPHGPRTENREAAYAAKRTLVVGERKRGSGEIIRDMTCEICAIPVRKASLVGHVWTHTGLRRPESPTQCPTCGIEMATKQAIGLHRHTHHDYDPLGEAYALARENMAAS